MRLGPLGSLREVATYPEVQVETERPKGAFTSLGGRRYAQRSPRRARAWSLSYQYATPADLAYLTALAEGAVPLPIYLYTDVAAQTNLLPADIAAPGQLGVSGLLLSGGVVPTRGRVSALMGNTLTSLTAIVCESTAGDWSATTPLPLGDYRLSVWASSAGSAITWRTVDAAGAQVATGTISAASTSGSYRGEATVTLSGGAVGIQVRTPAAAGRYIGALRLTATSTAQTASEWYPGHGVPEVVVDDPEQTVQLVTSTQIASDYSITLREVL